jgi:DedD protein
MEDNDVQLQLEKRARRRLVGAVAFVSVVALGLPMVMDHEPRQALPDVEIRIPGQDEKPFAPRFAAEPVQRPAAKPAEVTPATAARSDSQPSARVVEVTRGKDEAKAPPKAAEKPVAKAAEKPAAKPAEKPVAKPDEGKRAAAILAGQAGDALAAKAAGEYLVLIGAFSNEANVRNLKSKLGEQGIKAYSEPLDTPQGRKTRVRAGPFATREAAEKALAKMQKIGVSGVVAPRQ